MTVLQTVDGRMLPVGVPPFGGKGDPGAYSIVTGGHGAVALSGNLTTTYEMIYEANPYCAAVVNKLVRQIATLPLKVFDRPSGLEAPVECRTHPVAELLNHPAPRRGTSYLLQGLMRSALVHGNGVVAKYRPGGDPSAPPTALLPVSFPYAAAYAPLGAPIEWWATYQTGTQRYFPVMDSLHLAFESQDLHGLGVSPLKQLASTVKIDDAARRYISANFANGARPSGGIVPPADYKYQEGQRERLKAELKAQQTGVDNAGSLALLAPGFTWLPFSHTAVESEIMAARQFSREEICSVYDVPGPLVNDMTRATYSNVSELHRMLYITTLRPWFALLEEILQAQLVDNEPTWNAQEVFVQFDLTTVLRGNRREEIDAASQAYVNGLMTLNESRQFLQLSPIDHPLADIPNVPSSNNTPLHLSAQVDTANGVATEETQLPATTEGGDPNDPNTIAARGSLAPPAPAFGAGSSRYIKSDSTDL